MITDIVNSSRLKLLVEGETSSRRDIRYRTEIKEPHDHILFDCVQEAGGHKVNSTGDGYVFAFVDAEEAVLCALKIQARLTETPIPTPLGPLEVRIGLHTGIADPKDGDYIAASIDKVARVQGKAGGGEVFISHETHALVAGKLHGVAYERLGDFDLKGLGPQELYRVVPASASPAPREGPEAHAAGRADEARAQRTRRITRHLALGLGGAGLVWGLASLTTHLSRDSPAGTALRPGSRWSGTFRFLPPMEDYTGDVHLRVTEREGDRFQGVYTTENGKYEWQIEGTLHGERVRWEFMRAIQDNEEGDVVGQAFVEGTLKGATLRVQFHIPKNNETAKMELRLSR